MAALEFTNGEGLGSVRNKLNANAKEINKKADKAEIANFVPTAADSPIKIKDVWYCTQAQYDALSTKVSTRKYEILEP